MAFFKFIRRLALWNEAREERNSRRYGSFTTKRGHLFVGHLSAGAKRTARYLRLRYQLALFVSAAATGRSRFYYVVHPCVRHAYARRLFLSLSLSPDVIDSFTNPRWSPLSPFRVRHFKLRPCKQEVSSPLSLRLSLRWLPIILRATPARRVETFLLLSNLAQFFSLPFLLVSILALPSKELRLLLRLKFF